jgi:hypothetical protein
VVDLQERVAEQITGMSFVVQDTAGELAVSGPDAIAGSVGGRAADVLTGEQALLVGRDALQAKQPVLERVVVQEPGIVGAGVALKQPGIGVSILDRSGDQASGLAPDDGAVSYGFYEVIDSTWPDRLTAYNRRNFPDFPTDWGRHFFVSRHDASARFLAHDLTIEIRDDGFDAALSDTVLRLWQ